MVNEIISAVVFPGQGAQSVGMLGLYKEAPEVQETFAEASEILGYDAYALACEGPLETLNQTEFTQPVLLTTSVALARLHFETIAKASFFAGHSLGEYAALVCANAIPFSAAVRLVQLRGKLMQEAVPNGVGAMMVILGIEASRVERACQEVIGNKVWCANYNTPEQIVIAGLKESVLEAGEIAKTLGAKRTLLLPVSVPSHCPLMKPMESAFSDALAKVSFSTPRVPVIQNVSAEPISDPNRLRQNLQSQLSEPVRWTESVQKLAALGVTQIFESGPGKVLSGLIGKIDPNIRVGALP